MTRAFIFPGQGSQVVGMGKELTNTYPLAREVFEEVDEALNRNLSKLIFEGPEDDLTLTENAQPAIMATSVAIMRILSVEGKLDLAREASHVAGHSLGEYSALAVAGAFSLSDAARILQSRGRAMQAAVPLGEGAMAVFIGLSLDDAYAVAEEAANYGVCDFANDNAPGQVVVSGSKVSIEKAIVLAKKKGARRAIMLPVSAPFHCALMTPAADVLREVLSEIVIKNPIVPIVSNVVAEAVTDAGRIRELLVEQVTGRVRWRECVLAMKHAGVGEFIEIGAGKVLSGLVRRIDRDFIVSNVDTPEDVVGFLKI